MEPYGWHMDIYGCHMDIYGCIKYKDLQEIEAECKICTSCVCV